jgi:ubiquinone/menaquinone biosynthesis C-methylase UbiE
MRGPAARLGVLAAALLGAAFAQGPARPPDIHFTPTRHAVADAMLALAATGPGDVVIDLGSGDGRIPIIAAQKYGARGIGIEIRPDLVALSRQVASEGGVADRVRFVEGDLLTADLSEATVITMYLSTTLTRELESRMRALAPGTRIVSHQFRFREWAPDRTETIDGNAIYLWMVPR